MKKAAAISAGVAVFLVLAGCGESEPSQTYSVDEARAAFRGFELRVVQGSGPAGNLRPTTGEGFLVSVEKNDVIADDAWPQIAPQYAQDKAFAARRANVAVTPNDNARISGDERGRILAALRALPDRGDPVMVATQK